MKRLFLTTFIFIILHSVSAFCSLTVDDYKRMEIEGIEPTYNEITQDQTSYENWIAYIDGKTDSHYNLPSFSDVAVLTENLLAYSIGNYADVASGVFDNLVDTFALGSEIWDFMTFNVQQMAFDYAPDFVNLLRLGVDDEIYIPSSSPIGYWYPLPVTVSISNQSASQRQYFVSDSSVYMCCISKSGSGDWTRCDLAFAIRGNDSATYSFYGGTYNVDTSYIGTVYSGFYSLRYGTYFHDIGIAPTTWTVYSSLNDALADFFGDASGGGDSILTDAIIVNENPQINPITLTSALGYPFKETIINNYNNNTPIPWLPNNYTYVDYNYNYEVPFWEGQELETLYYPEEIEFPSIEFETVAIDENLDLAIESLDGSWIVKFFFVAILLLILGLIL